MSTNTRKTRKATASLLALIAALALGGCATWLYSKPGADNAQTRTDMLACRDQTQQATPAPSAGDLTWKAIGEALSIAALGPGGAGMATQPESVDPAHQAPPGADRRLHGRQGLHAMSKHSLIAWTDHTFNPWSGCTKDEVNYRYSGVTEQLDRGLPVTACGTCARYLPPPTPSQPARCQIVEPPIQGNGYCDKFKAVR